MIRWITRWFSVLFLLLMTGCSPLTGTARVFESPEYTEVPESITPLPTSTLLPVLSTQTPTACFFLTATGTAKLFPTATPTPNPYYRFTIDYLTEREYGRGEIEVLDTLADNSYFTRYLISFTSDGLTIYGFINVPKRGEPPYPVVIAIHGYIDPEIYSTLDYTTGYADALARAGYVVLHPNLRNYPPSDDDENLFRVGMAIDVLNLLSIVKESAGKSGILETAKPQVIGLWGHSMGGGISLRVLTVSHEVKAAVLYGSMSGDERRNFEAIYRWSGGERGGEELDVPIKELDRISPIFYLDRIEAAVSIHHGESDTLVPIQWSLELCDQLENLDKQTECFTYPGQPHTFYPEGADVFNQRVIEFYNKILRP